MERLNYQYLLYFWTVAKEGSIAMAAERLRLTQPTISVQIRKLEEALETRLFRRQGRNLVLTEQGKIVYRYAEEIFTTGRELVDTLKGRPTGSPVRFNVGVADALPKLATFHLLRPVFELEEQFQIRCFEGKPSDLFVRLSIHELDLVLCDAPVGPEVSIRAFNHLLGESPILVMGTPGLTRRYRPGFPGSLNGAPCLLPMEGTALRRALDHWFDENRIRPETAGEFDDPALCKVFGKLGKGLVFVPSIIKEDVVHQFGFESLGVTGNLSERFYAVSLQRRVRHPAVVAITESARRELLLQEESQQPEDRA